MERAHVSIFAILLEAIQSNNGAVDYVWGERKVGDCLLALVVLLFSSRAKLHTIPMVIFLLAIKASIGCSLPSSRPRPPRTISLARLTYARIWGDMESS
jgi:hypothetical protein